MSDEFDPLTGDPLPKTNKRETGSNSQVAAQTPSIPAMVAGELEAMTRDELLAFVKCLPVRITGYALQTKEEKREALKLEVYAVAMSNTLDAVKLKAANDWLDREDGKATQRIEQKNLNVNVTAAKDMTTEEIMARLSRASPAALQAAGVKLIGGEGGADNRQ